jgi:creatinine amidohydrolase
MQRSPESGEDMLSFRSTADEIHEDPTDLAILPIGSTEQHGHHLPVGTDFLIAGAVAGRAAERLGAWLLPALPVSTCLEHRGKRGSVWMGPDTFMHMLTDIVLSLKAQGFRRVAVVLGHGGIFAATPAIRKINADNPDIRVIKVDFDFCMRSLYADGLLECGNNLHACEYETSLMLYLHEDLVRKDKIVDFVPDVPRDYLNYASLLTFSPDGVWGMPSLATKEKGGKIFQILVDKTIEYINAVSGI